MGTLSHAPPSLQNSLCAGELGGVHAGLLGVVIMARVRIMVRVIVIVLVTVVVVVVAAAAQVIATSDSQRVSFMVRIAGLGL